MAWQCDGETGRHGMRQRGRGGRCGPEISGCLTALVKTRLRRMQYRPGLLAGFLAKTGLDLTLR